MAFVYCHRLHLSVCVCPPIITFVRTITCRPLKLQSPKFDQKCKTPWLRSLSFVGFIDLDFQGQIELESQNLFHFGLVSFQIEVRLSKFGQKCILALLRSLLILGLIDLDLGFYFKLHTCYILPNFASHSFASFCIYLVRPWPVSVPHLTWLRTYTDSYARGQGPAIDCETV